jgi:hypothetical protein
MQQRTAGIAAQIVYMITVQPQSKMHSWNEWLALLCAIEHASMQRTAVVLRLLCLMITRTATIKDAQLDEWLAWFCSHSAMHNTQHSPLQHRSTQQIVVHDNRTATIKDVQLE